jgi:hypothetical protein
MLTLIHADLGPESATLISIIPPQNLRGYRSVSFWGPWILICYSEVQIWIRILPLSIKNSKKNLYFYCFVTSL